MTPKQKAEELVGKFSDEAPLNVLMLCAKRWALITADLITEDMIIGYDDPQINYWEKVKEEINKL